MRSKILPMKALHATVALLSCEPRDKGDSGI